MDEIADQLRKKLSDDPRPSREIGELLEMNPVSVRKFLCGSMGLSLDKLEKLAEILGFRIVSKLKKISK